MSAEGTVACNCVLLLNWVGRLGDGVSTQTESPDANPVPFTVKVKAPLLVSTVDGLMFDSVRGAGTVNEYGADAEPLGLDDRMDAVPGVCTRFTGTGSPF